jgi:hypothetical protein
LWRRCKFCSVYSASSWSEWKGSCKGQSLFGYLERSWANDIQWCSLCIFCIRKRRQAAPVAARPPPKTKKPALRRAEAREKLNEVTEVVSLVRATSVQSRDGAEDDEGKLDVVETRSVLEREWWVWQYNNICSNTILTILRSAICLSTLHAPAPPEPAKLSPETPITDDAALPASLPQSDSIDPTATTTTSAPESETILKLQVCGHEFHADCLTSWFVLRKTSCPICRSVYMSKEAMQQHDEEERIALGGDVTPAVLETGNANQLTAEPVSNWRYFLHGSRIRRQQEARAQTQSQPAMELQNRTPETGEQAGPGPGPEPSATVDVAVPQPDQPSRPRWQRLLRL